MKTLTYDRLARDFPRAWAAIESRGEEVGVTRHRRRVACIVPEPPPTTALEVFGDLYGMLGESGGDALADALTGVRKGGQRRGTLPELRNPWGS